MTINYLETLLIISVFQNPAAVNQAALSPMAGNPSKISDSFQVQLGKNYIGFHWLIDPLNNLLTALQTHWLRGTSGDLWSNLYSKQARRGEASTAFVSPTLENFQEWSLYPISSHTSQSCQSEPSELQLGTSSAPLCYCLLPDPLSLARDCFHHLWLFFQ